MSEPNNGRWSDERLASASYNEVLDLLLQLQWRVARGGTQADEVTRIRHEIERRLALPAPEPAPPEPRWRERLIARLMEALRPFARWAQDWPNCQDEITIAGHALVTVGDLRRAQAALDHASQVAWDARAGAEPAPAPEPAPPELLARMFTPPQNEADVRERIASYRELVTTGVRGLEDDQACDSVNRATESLITWLMLPAAPVPILDHALAVAKEIRQEGRGVMVLFDTYEAASLTRSEFERIRGKVLARSSIPVPEPAPPDYEALAEAYLDERVLVETVPRKRPDLVRDFAKWLAARSSIPVPQPAPPELSEETLYSIVTRFGAASHKAGQESVRQSVYQARAEELLREATTEIRAAIRRVVEGGLE